MNTTPLSISEVFLNFKSMSIIRQRTLILVSRTTKQSRDGFLYAQDSTGNGYYIKAITVRNSLQITNGDIFYIDLLSVVLKIFIYFNNAKE